MSGFSLAEHLNINRNISRILNGMRVKVSQQLHPMTFKLKVIFPCKSHVYLCIHKIPRPLRSSWTTCNSFTDGWWSADHVLGNCCKAIVTIAFKRLKCNFISKFSCCLLLEKKKKSWRRPLCYMHSAVELELLNNLTIKKPKLSETE
jgi:hypothetical protein